MATITIKVTVNGTPYEGAELFTTRDTVKRVTDANGEYSTTVPADYAQAVVIIAKTPNASAGGTHLLEAGKTLEFNL